MLESSADKIIVIILLIVIVVFVLYALYDNRQRPVAPSRIQVVTFDASGELDEEVAPLIVTSQSTQSAPGLSSVRVRLSENITSENEIDYETFNVQNVDVPAGSDIYDESSNIELIEDWVPADTNDYQVKTPAILMSENVDEIEFEVTATAGTNQVYRMSWDVSDVEGNMSNQGELLFLFLFPEPVVMPSAVVDIALSSAELFVATDPNGDVYVSGVIGTTSQPTPIFNRDGSTSALMLPNVTSGSFIVKYDSAGQVLSWVTFDSARIRDITSDSSGNLYACGTTGGTTVRAFSETNSPGSTFFTLPTFTSGFLIKWNAAGVPTLWTVVDSDLNRTVIPYNVTTDMNDDSVYLAGRWTNANRLRIYDMTSNASGRGTLIANLTHGAQGPVNFVAKWNAVGASTWQPRFVESISSPLFTNRLPEEGRFVAVDQTNSEYYYGLTAAARHTYEDWVFLEPAPAFQGGAFIAKLDGSSQKQVWTQMLLNAANATTTIVNRIILYSGIVDSDGNLYVCGGYTATAGVSLFDFSAPTQGSSTSALPATTAYDGFIVKWNAAGQVVSWFVINGNSQTRTFELALDADQNLYATGFYRSTIPVDLLDFSTSTTATPSPSTGFQLPATSNEAAFLASWTQTGTLRAWNRIEGTSNDRGVDISIDEQNNLYWSGAYQSTANIPVRFISFTPDEGYQALEYSTTNRAPFFLKFDLDTGAILL